MSRTVLTAQPATVRGRELTMSPASASGDAIVFGRNLVLLVRNDGPAPVTATIRVPRDFQGLDVADNVFDVEPGEVYLCALRPAVYARPRGAEDAGRVYVDYSTTDGVTRAVIGA